MKSLGVKALLALLLITGAYCDRFALPCLAESEASSSAGSESGFEGTRTFRRRHRRRGMMGMQRQQRQERKQMRQQAKHERQNASRPDSAYIHNYGKPKGHRRKHKQNMDQSGQPGWQPPPAQ